jgi:hypothetical protein
LTRADSFDRKARGGLAPWQQKRATEILRANIDGDISMEDVARECRLSVRHFSRPSTAEPFAGGAIVTSDVKANSGRSSQEYGLISL